MTVCICGLKKKFFFLPHDKTQNRKIGLQENKMCHEYIDILEINSVTKGLHSNHYKFFLILTVNGVVNIVYIFELFIAN